MAKTQIVIELDEKGVKVAAPLHDKVLCYGLLEIAKDVVRGHQQETQRIVAPPQDLVIPRLDV